MAKAASIKIKLVSTADTGFYYVTEKNSRTQTEKLSFKKYDPSCASTSSSRNRRSSKISAPPKTKAPRLERGVLFSVCMGKLVADPEWVPKRPHSSSGSAALRAQELRRT